MYDPMCQIPENCHRRTLSSNEAGVVSPTRCQSSVISDLKIIAELSIAWETEKWMLLIFWPFIEVCNDLTMFGGH